MALPDWPKWSGWVPYPTIALVAPDGSVHWFRDPALVLEPKPEPEPWELLPDAYHYQPQ